MEHQEIPSCLGTYEEDHINCNGDPESEEENEKCGWIRLCKAFQWHLAETGKPATRYLEAGSKVGDDGSEQFYATARHGYDKFLHFCVALVKAQKKSKEEVAEEAEEEDSKEKKVKGRLGPSEKAKKASKQSLMLRSINRQKKLAAMYEWFKANLIENSDLVFTEKGVNPGTGELFVIDRLKTSGYLSIYCKTATGKLPLVLLKFKTTTLTFDVELPVEIDTMFEYVSKNTCRKLAPEPIKDGLFKTVIRKADKERLAILAESIAYMVEKDIIDLTSVKGG